MSRSYPINERGMWRMYCDSCDYVDPDRFPRNECPPLEHYAKKNWLIGKVNDRCPTCRYRTDLPPLVVRQVDADTGRYACCGTDALSASPFHAAGCPKSAVGVTGEATK